MLNKPHHRASSLPRIFGCNGSLSVVPRVKIIESDEGHEGVMVHWHIARRAIEELGAIGPEGGLPAPDVPAGYVLPKNAEWMVHWGINHLRETVPPDWSLQVEVAMEWEFDGWILSGHQDWLAMSPDGKQAIGGDWKSGPKPVEPALTNEQMNGYMVLDKLTWPDLEEIWIQICQPRADEESGFERVSKFSIAGKLLDRAAAVLDQRMLAAMANPMELNTGPTQCAFCVGCSCPAIQHLQDEMKYMMTEEVLAQIKEVPDDALLGDFMVNVKTLDKPMEKAREMAVARLKELQAQDPAGIPALDAGCGVRITMKTQGGKFTVVNKEGAWQAVNELIPPERMPEVVTYSKTRLVDVIAEVRGIPKTSKNKVSGESVFEGFIGTHFEQGEKHVLSYQ